MCRTGVSGPGGIRTPSIPRSERGWSSGCLPGRCLEVSGGSRTRLSGLEDRCLGRSATDTSSQRKGRESNPQGSSLAPVRAGCRRPSACPSVRSLDGWIRTSVLRLPKPADDAALPHPDPFARANKKGQASCDTWPVRGSPGRFGVRVAEDGNSTIGPEGSPGPTPVSECHGCSRDGESSCPLLRPPGAGI